MIKKKCINISGKIVCGIRAAFVKEDGLLGDIIPRKDSLHEAILKLQSKMKLYKSLLISSPSNLAFKDGKFFGYYGRKKFYYPMVEKKGVSVFMSLIPGMKKPGNTFISNYIKCAYRLSDKKIYPKIFGTCNVNINIDIFYVRGSVNNVVKVKTLNYKSIGIVTKRIVTPSFDFNLCEKNRDIVMSIFTKLWTDKRYTAYLLSNEEKDVLYGDGFSAENPRFTKHYFKIFCKTIEKEVRRNKIWKSMRSGKSAFLKNLQRKYGNILYDKKEKRWYYVDFA